MSACIKGQAIMGCLNRATLSMTLNKSAIGIAQSVDQH